MSAFDIVQHHRARAHEAERRADHLEAERARLERLLALSLEVAVAEDRGWVAVNAAGELVDCPRPTTPPLLLEMLCASVGINPARPAWVEQSEREEQYRRDDEGFEQFFQALEELAT